METGLRSLLAAGIGGTGTGARFLVRLNATRRPALVAANAVVTRDVKPGGRVGGVPARPLPQPSPVAD